MSGIHFILQRPDHINAVRLDDDDGGIRGVIEIVLPQQPPPERAVLSETQNIGGFVWDVYWTKEAADKHSFRIDCNREQFDHLWLCRAGYAFEVCLADDGIWHMLPEMGPDWWFNSYNGVDTTLPHLHGEELNPTAVRVHINIVWAALESSLPELDAVLSLNYGDKSANFHVNRHLLAGNSRYFQRFFFGDLAQQRNNADAFDIVERADLSVVDLHAFGRMLYLVLHSAPQLEQKEFLGQVDSAELLTTLEFAVKYEFGKLIPYVEHCLIKRGPGTMDQLAVADAQNLPTLKAHCLRTLDVLEYGLNLADNTDLRADLNDVTRECLDQRIRQSAEEHKRTRGTFATQIGTDEAIFNETIFNIGELVNFGQ